MNGCEWREKKNNDLTNKTRTKATQRIRLTAKCSLNLNDCSSALWCVWCLYVFRNWKIEENFFLYHKFEFFFSKLLLRQRYARVCVCKRIYENGSLEFRPQFKKNEFISTWMKHSIWTFIILLSIQWINFIIVKIKFNFTQWITLAN